MGAPTLQGFRGQVMACKEPRQLFIAPFQHLQGVFGRPFIHRNGAHTGYMYTE
jgi:hypothetical protein